MKKVILFDLDGTIMNTKEGITKCVAYALDYYGIHVDNPDSLDFFIGPPLHRSFQDFYGFDSEKAAQAAAKYRERYKEIGVYECEPYPGMIDCIRQLSERGYVLGVATSKPEVFAIKIMEKYNLMQYFTTVTGSLLDNTRSDKKEVIEEAFKRLKIGEKYSKEEVLMVGDRKHDIIGAKEMGIESMGVRFGFAKGNELEDTGANYIVNSADEIFEQILMI